jgi:hypothetical protein
MDMQHQQWTEVSGQQHSSADKPSTEETCVPITSWAGWVQKRSGSCRADKNVLLLQEIKPSIYLYRK